MLLFKVKENSEGFFVTLFLVNNDENFYAVEISSREYVGGVTETSICLKLLRDYTIS